VEFKSKDILPSAAYQIRRKETLFRNFEYLCLSYGPLFEKIHIATSFTSTNCGRRCFTSPSTKRPTSFPYITWWNLKNMYISFESSLWNHVHLLVWRRLELPLSSTEGYGMSLTAISICLWNVSQGQRGHDRLAGFPTHSDTEGATEMIIAWGSLSEPKAWLMSCSTAAQSCEIKTWISSWTASYCIFFKKKGRKGRKERLSGSHSTPRLPIRFAGRPKYQIQLSFVLQSRKTRDSLRTCDRHKRS
jgi:hypothetical protein